MEMKKLKVATPHMAGYTGVLGAVKFVDGVSSEYLPRHIRDRMAAAMPFIEIDREGNEQPAGAQNRMIAEARASAPVMEPLARQTEEEKAAELAQAALDAQKIPEILTREQLEAIADKGGIKAVREVGLKWNAKHRSIVVLIEMILDAQRAYLAKRGITEEQALADRAAKKQAATEAEETPVEGEIVPAPLDEPSAANKKAVERLKKKLEAAASGDLGVAISE